MEARTDDSSYDEDDEVGVGRIHIHVVHVGLVAGRENHNEAEEDSIPEAYCWVMAFHCSRASRQRQGEDSNLEPCDLEEVGHSREAREAWEVDLLGDQACDAFQSRGLRPQRDVDDMLMLDLT